MRTIAFLAHAALLATAMGSLACAPSVRWVAIRQTETPCPPAPIEVPLPSLGHDPAPITTEVRLDARSASSDGGTPIRSFHIERERSGTQETLRAVIAEEGGRPLVVGDHGTVLVRDRLTGWHREDPGTPADLFAVGRLAPGSSSSTGDRRGKEGAFVAVGARGVAVRRDPDGTWHPEETGTTADLHALWGASLAVGAGGVMVARSPEGRWRVVPTWTTANLHGVGLCAGHVCAVGDGGVIVDCAFPAREPVCVPRKPPTEAALRVVTGEVLIFGEGVWLGLAPPVAKDPDPPPEWIPWRKAGPTVAGTDARAAARNTWLAETLVVGRRGAVWWIGNWVVMEQPVRRLSLPVETDLHGVTYARADAFLVGAEGTILKAAVQDLRLGASCPD